jgi:hypothetical protein
MSLLEERARDNGFTILEKTDSIDETTVEKGSIPKAISAAYVEKEGTVFLLKENGTTERIGSKTYWDKIMQFKVDDRMRAHLDTSINYEGPLTGCGLCTQHKNSTALLNLAVTNRCDLRCWYCFFYEERAGFIFEPSLDEIRQGIEKARKVNGYTPPVQITGGEPTLRHDLADIIRMSRELGSSHPQLNTNSVSIAINYVENPEETVRRVNEWVKAGLKTVYTSFDGLTPDKNSNAKNHYEIPFALEAFTRGGIKSIVLVPTVSQLNLHEAPDIVRFAVHNTNRGIRAVNFQPISLVGLIKKGDREKLRVVQSDIIEELERAFGFGMDAWYPVPTVAALADIVGRGPHVHFYNNEKCGVATYVYVDQEKETFTPITEFIDVEGFIADVNEMYGSTLKKAAFGASLLPGALRHGGIRRALAKKLERYLLRDELPNGEELSAIIGAVFAHGDYSALRVFHHNFMFLGMMHFQDYYNYDINRVQRCSIHYAAGDRLVPFCSYNVFPDISRDTFLAANKLTGEQAERLREDSQRAKERASAFRARVDELVQSPIYREVYDIRRGTQPRGACS